MKNEKGKLKILDKLEKIELNDFKTLKIIHCSTERQWETLYKYLIKKGFKKDGALLNVAVWTGKGYGQYFFTETGTWDDTLPAYKEKECVNFSEIIKTLKITAQQKN